MDYLKSTQAIIGWIEWLAGLADSSTMLYALKKFACYCSLNHLYVYILHICREWHRSYPFVVVTWKLNANTSNVCLTATAAITATPTTTLIKTIAFLLLFKVIFYNFIGTACRRLRNISMAVDLNVLRVFKSYGVHFCSNLHTNELTLFFLETKDSSETCTNRKSSWKRTESILWIPSNWEHLLNAYIFLLYIINFYDVHRTWEMFWFEIGKSGYTI